MVMMNSHHLFNKLRSLEADLRLLAGFDVADCRNVVGLDKLSGTAKWGGIIKIIYRL